MKRMLALLVLGLSIVANSAGSALATVSANVGGLLFTEAAMKEGNDWLELYVVDNAVDWSGTRFWDKTSVTYELPSADYSAVERIILHEETGTDITTGLVWHLYGTMGTGLGGTDDLLYLNDAGSGRVKDIIDVLIWANYNDSFSPSRPDANTLAGLGQWDNDHVFSATNDLGAWGDSDDISAGQSLARFRGIDGVGYWDAHSRADWYRETSPTPGGSNTQVIPEPATMILLGIGLSGLALMGKKKKK